MRTLTVFNHVSLDGYFVDTKGDMSWAHRTDPEWTEFAAENAKRGGALLLGRVTYEMMAGFWPTPLAAKTAPVVAERMNAMPKVVFSRTLETPAWTNTTVRNGDVVENVRRLKVEAGPDLALLGSGSLVGPLVAAGLVDELQVVVNPLVLGGGRSQFAAAAAPVALRLVKTRAFGNGNVVLGYAPV